MTPLKNVGTDTGFLPLETGCLSPCFSVPLPWNRLSVPNYRDTFLGFRSNIEINPTNPKPPYESTKPSGSFLE